MTTDLDSIPRDRLSCMIRNIAGMVGPTRGYRGKTLQCVVSTAFGVGSRSAIDLCMKAELSPTLTIPLKP